MKHLKKLCLLLPVLIVGLVLHVAGCCCTGGLDDDEIDLNIDGGMAAPVAAVSAAPSTEADSLEVAFDASASYDTDGTIVQYDWDFDNDGTWDLTDGGVTTTWTYEGAGTYTAAVRVTDNDGLTDTATTDAFTVPAATSPPVASGTGSQDEENPLTAILDASGSTDADGEIVQYDWDFDNDGIYEVIDGGPNPSHTFDDYGTYTVGVRVIDDDGLEDEGEIVVSLAYPPTGTPPDAVLVANPDHGDAPGLEVTWDASGSTDSDGEIVQYDWDMDYDGTYEIEDGGATQLATYDTPGVYTVKVRVVDNDGDTDIDTADCDVNDPPAADLTASPTSFTVPGDVTYDASGSTDSDGSVVRYDWDMDNDGTYEVEDGGATQSANYTMAGTYTVGVLVTDDDGATDSATTQVTASEYVNEAPVAVINVDPDWGYYPLTTLIDGLGSSDSDGSIIDYEWDFDGDGVYNETGDEETARGSAGPHTVVYPDGGTYEASLRVTDDGTPGATAVDSHEVHVYTDNDTYSITVNVTLSNISEYSMTSQTLVRLYTGDPTDGGTPVNQYSLDHVAAGDGNPATCVFESLPAGAQYYLRLQSPVVHWDGDAEPAAVRDFGPYEVPPDQVVDIAGTQYQEPPAPQ